MYPGTDSWQPRDSQALQGSYLCQALGGVKCPLLRLPPRVICPPFLQHVVRSFYENITRISRLGRVGGRFFDSSLSNIRRTTVKTFPSRDRLSTWLLRLIVVLRGTSSACSEHGADQIMLDDSANVMNPRLTISSKLIRSGNSTTGSLDILKKG